MILELSELLSEINGLTEVCTKCGMCQSVCPVYKATQSEQNVARGKIAVLEGLANKIFPGSNSSIDIVEKCLLCGACEKVCSRNVQTLELFIKARLLIHKWKGLSPFNRFLLRTIIAKPSRLKKIAEFLTSLKKWLPGEKINKIIFNLPEKSLSPVIIGGAQRTLAGSETANLNFKVPVNYSTKKKAVLFSGCIIPELFPEVIKDIIEVSVFFGIELEALKDAGCCGMPSVALGDHVSFKKLVSHNLKILKTEEFDYLVSACATCTFAIKKLWPGSDLEMSEMSLAGKIADNIMDFSSFLLDIAPDNFFEENKPFKSNKVVSLHDPCHLKNSFGITKEPRIILENSSYQFKDIGNVDSCCGAGGSFGFKNPALSKNIGFKLMEKFEANDADLVATSCPGCMLQLEGMAKLRNNSMEIKHVSGIAAEIIRNLRKKK